MIFAAEYIPSPRQLMLRVRVATREIGFPIPRFSRKRGGFPIPNSAGIGKPPAELGIGKLPVSRFGRESPERRARAGDFLVGKSDFRMNLASSSWLQRPRRKALFPEGPLPWEAARRGLPGLAIDSRPSRPAPSLRRFSLLEH